MPQLVWDQLGTRTFETGLDRGVLYLPDGLAVPWNGLTSVIEQFDRTYTPVYYDGRKINDLVELGDFAATMRAVTYPDEFLEMEGLYTLNEGLFVSDQTPKPFGLSYRTLVGNDLEGDAISYKIHLIYNVTAVPTQKAHATLSNEPSLIEFEWDIRATPEEVPGYRPTAHFVLDSRKIDPLLLAQMEEILYGSATQYASLPPLVDLATFIGDWTRIEIVDHGNGTWSAISEREEDIVVDGDHITIYDANAEWLDDDTYVINNTAHINDAS